MTALLAKVMDSLRRTDVIEVAVATGRLPCVKVGGTYQPIDATKLTMDAIINLLRAAGGGAQVDTLGIQSTHWTHRVEGLGVVGVVAVRKEQVVQARLAVARRDSLKQPSHTLPMPRSMASSAALAKLPASALAPAPLPSVSALPKTTLPVPAGPSSAGSSFTFQDSGLLLELDDRRGPVAAAPPPAPPDRLGEVSTGVPELDLDGIVPGGILPNPALGMPNFAPAEVGARAPVAPLGTAARVPPEVRFDGTFDSLLRAAREYRASDLHVIAERPPLFRIGGDLVPKADVLKPSDVEKMVLPIVPPRVRETFEREGSIDFAHQHETLGRFRVNVVRQRTGFAACLRLIPNEIPTIESLGLPPAVASATHHHQGLIVITGPTGHGKTTTLTAIVDLINTETTHHVITVEDPVEFLHPRKKAMMSQREVGTHTRSFRSALKGSLREDPDVIVIGELRDTETVRIALAASETGHLVIGTMNTPSAAKTIDRLIDLFPPADQGQVRMTLAGGLKLVMSQRLVPNEDRSATHAAIELLPGSVALWNLIRDNKTFQIPSLQQRGKALGIIRLDDSLLELIRAGETTLDNALAYAEAPEDLKSRVAAERAAAAPPEKKPEPAAKGGILGKAGAIFGKKG